MSQEKLFELVYILLGKKTATAKSLAEYFGVSERTIYRWTESLSCAGIPVFSSRGKGGGISIMENYTLDKTILTEEEKSSVVSSVKAVLKLAGMNSAEKSVLEKLQALDAKNSDWLEVDFSPWNPQGKYISRMFAELKKAVMQKTQIEFDYFSVGGKTERRIVHPWKIVFRGSGWYVYGWCAVRCAPRYFKLSRMSGVVILDKKNTVEQPEKTPDDNSCSAYDAPLIEVQVEIENRGMYRLMDEFPVCVVENSGEDSSRVKFSAQDNLWLVPFLLSFGSAVKILSPEQLKNRFYAEVEKMALKAK
ncbi:helix-turn-helix transcriptional regulator [Treponema sp.]|uniref:helix-turn-helix transcriptional regulator n=1 Tax=Treponema sp. TaxID=166 RepID=UPI003F0C7CF9